jgi:hypothetical protein
MKSKSSPRKKKTTLNRTADPPLRSWPKRGPKPLPVYKSLIKLRIEETMNPDPVHAQLLIFDRPPMLSIFLCAASDGIAAHQHRSISGSRHMHFSALRQTHDRRLGDRQNGARLGERKCVPVSWHTSQNRTALRWEKRITVRSYVSIVIFVYRLFATLKMSF